MLFYLLVTLAHLEKSGSNRSYSSLNDNIEMPFKKEEMHFS